MLFEKTTAKNSTEDLDAKLAQEIYSHIEKYGSVQAAYLSKETNFDFINGELVWDEIKRLEAEVMSKMAGTFVTTPAIPPVYDEMGEIAKKAVPAVYFTVKSEKMLTESLTSPLLDTAVLVNDTRRYSDGNPDEAPTFKDWQATFSEEPIVLPPARG